MNNTVSKCKRRRDKPVPISRHLGSLSDRQGQLGKDCRFKFLNITVTYRPIVERR